MNIQIRIQVPKPADAPDYEHDHDVQLITDPEIVRAVLRAILEVEHRRPAVVNVVNIDGSSHEEPTV